LIGSGIPKTGSLLSHVAQEKDACHHLLPVIDSSVLLMYLYFKIWCKVDLGLFRPQIIPGHKQG
jgi:hypothetical protein